MKLVARFDLGVFSAVTTVLKVFVWPVLAPALVGVAGVVVALLSSADNLAFKAERTVPLGVRPTKGERTQMRKRDRETG